MMMILASICCTAAIYVPCVMIEIPPSHGAIYFDKGRHALDAKAFRN